MNAIVKSDSQEERQLIEVLGNSLYPGAKPESIRLVLAWCRATGRDPLRKPVHIVGMSVKVGKDKYEWRDVIMPGVGTYRTDASRTGQYAGKSEPEFGPTRTERLGNVEVTFPEWCRVTVKRIVDGRVCDFPAKEYWMENYATAGRDSEAPNSMWKRRAFGQLAKCAESQALRMAFPEETGNTNTAEEMEGKTFDGVTIDAKPEPVSRAVPAPEIPTLDEAPAEPRKKGPTTAEWLASFKLAADACEGMSEYEELCEKPDVKQMDGWLKNGAKQQFETIKGMTLDRLMGMDIVQPQMETG